jgi:hypothetical protein
MCERGRSFALAPAKWISQNRLDVFGSRSALTDQPQIDHYQVFRYLRQDGHKSFIRSRVFFVHMASATMFTGLGMLIAPFLRLAVSTGWLLKFLGVVIVDLMAVLILICCALEVTR